MTSNKSAQQLSATTGFQKQKQTTHLGGAVTTNNNNNNRPASATIKDGEETRVGGLLAWQGRVRGGWWWWCDRR